MKFWMTTLILNLLMPVITMGIGILYLKKPSKNINWEYGYRTQLSMKSQETWDFAQRYFGKICWRWGVGVMLFTLIAMLLVMGRGQRIIGIVGTVLGTLEGFVMIYLLLPTEMALQKKFDTAE